VLVLPGTGPEAVERTIAGSNSPSTMRRWLKQDALKSWQYQSWIFVRDPAFRPKAARVLDLYTRTFDGTALGEDEYVISADEKTSIQAPGRCAPIIGIVPFMNLVTQVMSSEPYASVRRVFWIVDKTATTPRRSRSSGGSPPPTWMNCRPGSTSRLHLLTLPPRPGRPPPPFLANQAAGG
jgi:hypothetical protein